MYIYIYSRIYIIAIYSKNKYSLVNFYTHPIYIYIYIHTHTHTHTHIYIYIYIEREREKGKVAEKISLLLTGVSENSSSFVCLFFCFVFFIHIDKIF